MSELLLRCADVSRTYGRGDQAVVAVHSATCDVHRGDRIALVGRSGSGKSTLLHLMAGLEPPTSGTMTWPGVSTEAGHLTVGAGVIFQGPSLIPALDVVENVALPLVLAGVPDRVARARAHGALASIGIDELATALPDELSGGQSQRVAVARVVAVRPPLILADEPTGRLDRPTGERLVTLLIAVADELDAALVVATHDAEMADRLDERWEMHDGRLAGTLSIRPAAGR
jgi:putative ABC transport system ATP-binding protein